MEKMLINAGVKHLKEYGYPDVNKDNILTDMIYSAFFKKMLDGTKDDAQAMPAIDKKQVTEACDKLLAQIEKGAKKV